MTLLAALFDTFDLDGGGTITTDELYKQLRAGRDVDLSNIQVKDKLGRMHDVSLAAETVAIEMPSSAQLAVLHEADGRALGTLRGDGQEGPDARAQNVPSHP